MSNSNSKLKSINELLEFNFEIPSYQRGYRWTDIQVNELLDDLWEFTQKEKKKEEFYCLQPIVVSKIENNKYSVIDGQQRLTTIYIILNTLKPALKLLFPKKELFTLSYKTREKSAVFLETIDQSRKNENIDFYHMCWAQDTVKKWFEVNDGATGDVLNTLLKDNNNVKVIWYEPGNNVDPIEVFTRLNMGKIGLTNAELVKALILSSSHPMTKEDEKKLYRKQREIASEWDLYESKLRNDEFWGFLKNEGVKYDNHIELLFDLLADNIDKEGNRKNRDKYHTFHYFYAKINSVQSAWQLWDNDIKPLFQQLDDWFSNKFYYHLIGFLISAGEHLGEIISETNNYSKTDFKKYIREKVEKYIPKGKIEQLVYHDEKPKLRNVLLLFNVLTILENPKSNLRFQFGRYKNEKWDIEHIHSVKSEMPQALAHQYDWLREVKEYTDNKKLIKDIDAFMDATKENKEDFEKLYERIWNEFSEEVDKNSSERDINDISNLALLDSGTNRGYKNAVFPIKRKKIIEKDEVGTFIPLCTKNVFLKYYNTKVSQSTFWGRDDRVSYKNKLIEIINNYQNGKDYEQ